MDLFLLYFVSKPSVHCIETTIGVEYIHVLMMISAGTGYSRLDYCAQFIVSFPKKKGET
jgi:hypothetical protein